VDAGPARSLPPGGWRGCGLQHLAARNAPFLSGLRGIFRLDGVLDQLEVSILGLGAPDGYFVSKWADAAIYDGFASWSAAVKLLKDNHILGCAIL